jgi:gliding motility-associated-like protein
MKYFLFPIFLLLNNLLIAQCSLSITTKGKCSGDAIILEAILIGNIANGKKPQWVQTSGPKVTIQNDNQLKAHILPPLPTGNLGFKLIVPCEQGNTVESITNLTIYQKPDAGKDTSACGNFLIGIPPKNMDWYSLSTNHWSLAYGSIGYFVSPNEADSYILALRDTISGCEDTINIKIKCVVKVVRNNINDGLPFCIEDNVALYPKSVGVNCGKVTFQWYEFPNFNKGSVGKPIQGATDSIYHPPHDKPGTFFYKFAAITSEGCASFAAHEIRIAKNVSAGVPIPAFACQGEKRILQLRDYLIGEDSSKFQSSWRCLNTILPKETFDSKKGLVVPEKLAVGQYKFEYYITYNSCTPDTSVVTLTIRPPLLVNAGIDRALTCKDKIAILGTAQTPQNQYISKWKALGNSSIISNADVLKVNKSGTYILTVKDTLAGCEAQDTVEVKNQQMSVDFSFTTIRCNEQFGTAKATILQNGTPPINYILDKQASNNDNFEKISEGKHQIIVSDAADCRDTFNFSLIKPLPLSVDFSPKDSTLESGDTLLLKLFSSLPNTKIKAMTWFTNNQPSDKILIFQKSIKPSQDTHYQVIVESTDGCKDTATALIKVIKSSDYFAPTAFSPNNDQINDAFKIYPNPKKIIKINSFDIFDRWGNHILHQENMNQNDSNFGWDGTFRNELLSQGVYIWKAEIEFFDGKKKKLNGDFMLEL